MSKETTIQWCDSTVNPTMGCDGCELWSANRRACYAGSLHRLRRNHKGFAPSFEQLTMFPGRMAQAARWSDLSGTARPTSPWLDGLPRCIFVSDMSDALSDAVTFEYLHDEIIANVTSDDGLRHRWLWLSKRPRRMVEFSQWLTSRGIRWPANLWPGTSVTTTASLSRIDSLGEVGDDTTHRFVSVEPQWESIHLGRRLESLSWVIQGGESGSQARPFDVAWAVEMQRECRDAGVPYFLKQLGAHIIQRGQRLRLQDGHGGDWSEWPAKLRVREVFHKGARVGAR